MLSVKHSVYTTVGRVRELNLQTSYLFDINCHFHAVYVTLLNIKVHLKLYFFSLEFPLNCGIGHSTVVGL